MQPEPRPREGTRVGGSAQASMEQSVGGGRHDRAQQLAPEMALPCRFPFSGGWGVIHEGIGLGAKRLLQKS